MDSKKTKDNKDLQLFKEAMQDVTPLKHDRVINHPRTTSKKNVHRPEQNQLPKDGRRFSTENVPECDIILGFERPGVQKTLVKKLRQGKMPIEISLDLHGYTAEEARSAMIEFMHYCQQEKFRVVCIVHGKGFGSDKKKPVIKPLVNKWLRELDEVLAFTSAQPKDGGTGAVYVLLRRTDKADVNAE